MPRASSVWQAAGLGVVECRLCVVFCRAFVLRLVLLPTVGRSGRAARPALMNFTPIGAGAALGFLSDGRLLRRRQL